MQLSRLHSVPEIIPIGAIEDYPGHLRHAQLCACGSEELIHALKEAEKSGWDFFVIV